VFKRAGQCIEVAIVLIPDIAAQSQAMLGMLMRTAKASRRVMKSRIFGLCFPRKMGV
jgi:hypothetical protein